MPKLPPDTVRLLLVRHGETAANVVRRIQGQSDEPLSPRGKNQARRLGARLAGERLDALYASPLTRAWHTARLICRPHPELRPRPEARLQEMAYGAWEGLTWEEVRRRYPVEWQAWARDQENAPPHGGERLSALGRRVGELARELRTRHGGQTVLLVGHGGSLRALICVTFGIPLPRYGNLALGNTALSELHLSPGGATLHTLNDLHHLGGM